MRVTGKKSATALTVGVLGALAIGSAGGAQSAPSGHDHHAHHHASLKGTVSSVSSGSFGLTEGNGNVVTVDVTPTTTYAESGTSTAPTGVASGDHVVVEPAHGTTSTTTTVPVTTVTARRILIALSERGGTVQTVGANSFTILGARGQTQTIDTTPSTTYTEGSASETGVTTGEAVFAFGTLDAAVPSQLDALFVHISTPHAKPGTSGDPAQGRPGAPPQGFPSAAPHGSGDGHNVGPDQGQKPAVTGTVTSISGDDIVVTDSAGSSSTVVVGSATKYYEPSGPTTLNAVTVGENIAAWGTTDSSGDIDAVTVVVGQGSGTPPAGKPANGNPAPNQGGAGHGSSQSHSSETENGSSPSTPPSAPSNHGPSGPPAGSGAPNGPRSGGSGGGSHGPGAGNG